MKTNSKIALLLAAVAIIVSACSKNDWEPDFPDEPGFGMMGGGTGVDDSDAPDFNPVIEPWDGTKANDAGNDKVDGSNTDIYHEANTFTEKVTVKFDGTSATVGLQSGSQVKYVVNGAYVVIDMLTNSVKDVEIVASGKSHDGQLKIYGEKKFKLTLDGLELTSTKGPAINDQCKKRVFVHLPEGTSNKLVDCATYSKEPYYLTATGEADEDRKGCFFSEGNMIFSGSGVLEVTGKYRHGIATDGYMWMRPGVTIVVTEAAKNAVHVKGDATDEIGFQMEGGLLYTNVASVAGKGIKTDLHAVVNGGRLLLNQSGDSTYDESENDTSSPAGIKTDGNIIITGGTHVIKSTGAGGKGINSNGTIQFTGGETTVTTTGGTYYKSQGLKASSKGIKADGNLTISGGAVNIAAMGKADNVGSPEGLESKSVFTMDGGTLYSYATDDAINAITGIEINGGKIYAHSTTNDAIDSNGYFHVNGGLIIANGASGAEEALDCEYSSQFLINGGTIFGTGGTAMHSPSSSSKQKVVIYGGLTVAKNDLVSVLDPSGKPANTCQIPRGMSGSVMFYSSPNLESNQTYTISKNGKLSDYTDTWNGWYSGGTWSGGEQVGTFTPSSAVTVVGQSTGSMAGGFGGM